MDHEFCSRNFPRGLNLLLDLPKSISLPLSSFLFLLSPFQRLCLNLSKSLKTSSLHPFVLTDFPRTPGPEIHFPEWMSICCLADPCWYNTDTDLLMKIICIRRCIRFDTKLIPVLFDRVWRMRKKEISFGVASFEKRIVLIIIFVLLVCMKTYEKDTYCGRRTSQSSLLLGENNWLFKP